MEKTHLRISPEDKDNEVWTYFGVAAYYSQLLERGILQLVAVLDFQSELFSSGSAQMDEIYSKINRKTMGQLICKARKISAFPKSVEKLLNDSLETRNFLIHQFFYYHALDHINMKGRAKMVDELQRIAMLFKKTEMELEKFQKNLNSRIGITEEMAEKSYRELLERFEDE